MTTLQDLFDVNLYTRMVQEGYVREQTHPTLPLVIAKYTEKASYEREWNEVTLSCRGLVFDVETNQVVVRCLPKFFNYDEVNAPDLSGHTVEVFDKLDGSLIQVASYKGARVVTSSGSFTSDHALLADKLLGDFIPMRHCTHMFELVSPMNRIVVDYGGITQLFALATVNNRDGSEYPVGWGTEPFPEVVRYPYDSITEALSADPRVNAEGFVVRSVQTGQRVKIKQEDYIRLHRIVTNTTPKAIWEILSSGQDFSKWLEGVPDEFYLWVHGHVSTLRAQYDDLIKLVHEEYIAVKTTPSVVDRRSFAMVAKNREVSAALFMLLDGRDISDWAWKQLKPRGDAVFAQDEE